MKHDESILVVKRNLLFSHKPWQGFKTDNTKDILHTIEQHHQFQPRGIMETDPEYKQIIPYMIFTHDNQYFLMQRKATASDQRLKNKFSLGIGGHVRKEDINNASFEQWGAREFQEEITYPGSYTIKLVGILNDESTPVGQVHMGLIFLLQGNKPEISIKSELQSGSLVSLEKCKAHYEQMEKWSQIIFNEFLIQ